MDYVDTAKEYSIKFDFYLLALTFTLLGLAIQTSDFSTSKFASILELLGWLVLFISGAIGLIRLERFPLLYLNLYNRKEYSDRLSESDCLKYDDFIKQQDGALQTFYAWQRSLFVTGFFW